MTTLREAAQQALEALCLWATGRDMDAVALNDLILRLDAALAEPEPCRYPDCVDNGPDGKCTRWLLAECSKSEDYKPKRPAEPVQDHFPDATKMVHEPVQETEMRRCPRCWEPMFPPQPTPLTVERLRDALVASRIVPPAAVEDPDGYDDGVTLHRIEALHRRLA